MLCVQAFSVVFEQAIDRAEPAEEVEQRVVNLIDSITYSVFIYTTRGLFERDKLIFTAQMTFLVSTTKHTAHLHTHTDISNTFWWRRGVVVTSLV